MSTGFGTGRDPWSADAGGEPGRRVPGADAQPAAAVRHRWYSAVGVTAGLALLAGGVVVLLPRQQHPARSLADNCGLVNCGATLPASSAPGSTASSRPHPAHDRAGSTAPRRGHGHAPPTAAPSPGSPAPSPSGGGSGRQSPAAKVTVTYTPGKHHSHRGRHLVATLTLVNHGRTPVSSWTVRLGFPGDTIGWVGYQPGSRWVSFGTWQESGSTLIMTASADGETIAAGGSLTVTITARGTTTNPASCTFNGAACQP